ncbi:hypothetical protein ILYODFUR_023956 [Ilyodon furcidens]|uniref:Uncharacterized protein n=1 Tax=Ilyodon furcidens TaxID=33524 RepID=A0ABV0SPH3_9TELE
MMHFAAKSPNREESVPAGLLSSSATKQHFRTTGTVIIAQIDSSSCFHREEAYLHITRPTFSLLSWMQREDLRHFQ